MQDYQITEDPSCVDGIKLPKHILEQLDCCRIPMLYKKISGYIILVFQWTNFLVFDAARRFSFFRYDCKDYFTTVDLNQNKTSLYNLPEKDKQYLVQIFNDNKKEFLNASDLAEMMWIQKAIKSLNEKGSKDIEHLNNNWNKLHEIGLKILNRG